MNSTNAVQGCPYCGSASHIGVCPLVKAIEYYENGAIKRVEMKGPNDFAPVYQQSLALQEPKPFWQSHIIGMS